MEKVVYILGAGFSVPLGIPAVGTFLDRSKDLYTSHPDRFSHFQDVFRRIREMAQCKNYYTIDLFSIEEILSLMEMRAGIAGELAVRQSFIRYILDVVKACTPPVADPVEGVHWTQLIFGPELWRLYGPFVSTVLNCSYRKVMERKHTNSIEYDLVPSTSKTEYSVITFNYDLVLENIASSLSGRFGGGIAFRTDYADSVDEGGFAGYLAKLHGSVDTGEIVPPTWNKTLSSPRILRSWSIAHWLLSQANHVRVIGFSLPEADNYIKYLLRSAVIDNDHLKNFDVLCLDPYGDVKLRYDSFLQFPRYRFRSAKVDDYLQQHVNLFDHWPEEVKPDKLEQLHAAFFSR